MARKLPWKKTTGASSSTLASRSADVSASAGAAGSGTGTGTGTGHAEDSSRLLPALQRTPVSRRHQRVYDSDPIRSPSTSPPPEKPQDEFMIPGPLNDDRFRMVDDEFLHTAQRFTAHLHRAEYDRLKGLAASQNAATIREIERPVVASMAATRMAQRRQDSIQRLGKQRKPLEDTGGGGELDGEELSLPFMGTSLRGLMEAPRQQRKLRVPAASGASASSRTRAAAGYSASMSSPPAAAAAAAAPSSSSTKTTLGSPSSRSSHATPLKNSSLTKSAFKTPTTAHSNTPQTSHAGSSTSSTIRNLATRSEPTNRLRNAPFSDRKSGKRRASFLDVDDEEEEDDGDGDGDDDDPFGLNQRRLNRKKSREQFRKPATQAGMKSETDIKHSSKKINLDTIPSFL